MSRLIPETMSKALCVLICVFLTGCEDDNLDIDREKLPGSNSSELQQILKQFNDKQEAELAEKNKAVEIEFQRLSSLAGSYAAETDTLQNEAVALLSRYDQADADEKRNLESRLLELAEKIRRLDDEYPLVSLAGWRDTYLVQILQPIYDPHLHRESYGYRPKRSAQQAVKKIESYLKTGYTQVLDADLSGCFDSIPREELHLSELC